MRHSMNGNGYSTLGTQSSLFRGFDGNHLIRKFNEFRLFVNCTSIAGMYTRSASGFEGSTLEEISLPAVLTNIGDRAFKSCTNLKLLDIPSGVTAIGRAAIQDHRNVIICRAVSVPTLSTNNNVGTALIFVPDESVDLYKAATNWSTAQIANRIRPLSEFTE